MKKWTLLYFYYDKTDFTIYIKKTHDLKKLYLKELMMNWCNGEALNLHAIVQGAMLHAIFVGIHPFIDEKGRTLGSLAKSILCQ